LKKNSFFSILLLCCLYTKASDTTYAKHIVDTLSSSTFNGRGYISNGMKIAGQFIKNELQQLKVLPYFGNNYEQPFTYAVNTFPSNLMLSINGVQLKPGTQYIVDEASTSCEAAGNLLQLDSVTWINAKNNISVTLVDKLTWSVSQTQENFTSFKILKSAISQVPTSFEAKVTAKLLSTFKATNIAGYIKGTTNSDSLLVFTAHYDHLGAMGANTYFAGANDNASGVALLLSLAKHYAANPARHHVLFIAFAGEEAGLLGSKYFVKQAKSNMLSNIKFLTNLDLMGNGDEGITVVNATEFKKQYELLVQLNNNNNYLTAINSRGKAANSDHHWFTEKGVPSFFIYTLGKRKHYHDVYDVAATLPNYEMQDLLQLLTEFYTKL
jgi:aminopeptidase YwaD